MSVDTTDRRDALRIPARRALDPAELEELQRAVAARSARLHLREVPPFEPARPVRASAPRRAGVPV